MNDYLIPTYNRLPVAFVRGNGAWLEDDTGRSYLDMLSGIAVCGLGHCHPAVTEAICAQAQALVHTSNLYQIPSQARLAEKLCQVGGFDKAFFCNSGAEANEAAIKLARLYGHKKNIARPVVIVMNGSFHGRTMGALSATGNTRVQVGFEPLLDGFLRVPYNDVNAVKEAIANHSDIVAVLLEPVQGEGGIVVPATNYLRELREICNQHELLLMLDEVQTGMGRTGSFFAFQHAGIQPDVTVLAKGLANGLPMGCCLTAGVAAGIFEPGHHGSTFGGSPLACATASAVVDTILTDNLCARAQEMGDYLVAGFRSRLEGLNGVREIRHAGLMIGIELTTPCAALVKQALEQGLVINVTSNCVVRLLPPLILSQSEADQAIDILSGLIFSFVNQPSSS